MDKQQIDLALEDVFRRSMTDAGYRELCLRDGNSAFAAASGLRVPDGMKLRFIESAPDEMTLVLPGRQEASGELADAALAEVAGGLDIGLRDIHDYFNGCDRTCRASAGSAVAPGRCNGFIVH